MIMPLPVWTNLQQTMLRNTSNMPCDISDEEVLIIVLLVFAVIYLIIDIFINKWGDYNDIKRTYSQMW